MIHPSHELLRRILAAAPATHRRRASLWRLFSDTPEGAAERYTLAVMFLGVASAFGLIWLHQRWALRRGGERFAARNACPTCRYPYGGTEPRCVACDTKRGAPVVASHATLKVRGPNAAAVVFVLASAVAAGAVGMSPTVSVPPEWLWCAGGVAAAALCKVFLFDARRLRVLWSDVRAVGEGIMVDASARIAPVGLANASGTVVSERKISFEPRSAWATFQGATLAETDAEEPLAALAALVVRWCTRRHASLWERRTFAWQDAARADAPATTTAPATSTWSLELEDHELAQLLDEAGVSRAASDAKAIERWDGSLEGLVTCLQGTDDAVRKLAAEAKAHPALHAQTYRLLLVHRDRPTG